MTKEEIKQNIINLSKSQGFYCRILQQIEDNPELLDELEKQDFKDVIDLIFYFEQ